VAAWGGDHPGLVQALKAPHFIPYLGRKSCPLSAPMAPAVVRADTASEALEQVTLPPFLPDLKPVRIISDDPAGATMSETLWDEPLDRGSWHFGKRRVHVSVRGGRT
jgi:CRISPR system Cascade subunit CasD